MIDIIAGLSYHWVMSNCLFNKLNYYNWKDHIFANVLESIINPNWKQSFPHTYFYAGFHFNIKLLVYLTIKIIITKIL